MTRPPMAVKMAARRTLNGPSSKKTWRAGTAGVRRRVDHQH